jgi:hypothetical protein
VKNYCRAKVLKQRRNKMKRFWEKEKVMIKERSFSMLLAMGENEYNIICIERFRSERELSYEYQTRVIYRLKDHNNGVKAGMFQKETTEVYDFELNDEQHEKLIEEISKKIACIVISK